MFTKVSCSGLCDVCVLFFFAVCRSFSASVGEGVFVDFEANASSINSVPSDEVMEGDHSSCFLNSSDFEAVEASSFRIQFCILYLMSLSAC